MHAHVAARGIVSLVTVLAPAAAPSAPPPAMAPGEAETGPAAADRLKAAADAAFRRGAHLEALLFLEQAWKADPRPGFLANKGLVLERLGEYERALAAYRRYLETEPPPEKRTVVEVAIDRLRPEVLIVSDPPGAEVMLDDDAAPRGRTPLRMRVPAGSHLVRFRLAGHRDGQAPLVVEPGRGGAVQVTLAPLETPPARPHRTWGYIALGGALSAGIAGGVLLTLARTEADARDDADSLRAWHAHDDRAQRLANGGYVAFGVGALALGVAAWLLLGQDDPAPPTDPGLSFRF